MLTAIPYIRRRGPRFRGSLLLMLWSQLSELSSAALSEFHKACHRDCLKQSQPSIEPDHAYLRRSSFFFLDRIIIPAAATRSIAR